VKDWVPPRQFTGKSEIANGKSGFVSPSGFMRKFFTLENPAAGRRAAGCAGKFRKKQLIVGSAATTLVGFMFENIGEVILLFWRTLLALPKAWRQRDKVFEQFFEIGNASLLMVCVLSFFIGAVIALQTGPVLVERSLGSAVGGVVGIAIAKELAPVMMAILIAGRIGSAMAAEIGSMRVYQEIDALRTMNINPIHYLVMPRIVAIAVALPLLVTFSVLVGWFGGAVVAEFNHRMEIPIRVFFSDLRDIVELKDVANGIFKSFCFAIIIGVVSCHQGLVTIGGPRGIGRSVTKAVVNSIVLIVIFDYLLTRTLLK
jgi:phospholipid/cholesterol/gamma-HCH transport system permease protein